MVVLLSLLACAWITDEEKAARRDRDGDGLISAQFGGDDCDDTDAEVRLGEPWYADADGDGWGNEQDIVLACEAPPGRVATPGDCNDIEPEAYPDAIEVCDEIDNDCDGLVDEEDPDLPTTTWYLDADGDGWGDENDSLVEPTCEQPSGYVLEAGDCEDEDDSVHPAADEICNRVDDDCDGLVDDEDEDTELGTWYADLDQDGYGDAEATVQSCEPPAGYLSDDADCDDEDPGVHPGAAEVCDGEDQDCDGEVDDDAVDERLFYEDADGDGFGDADSTVAECEAPTGYVDDDTDCDDGEASTYPGAEEECGTGVDSNCDGSVDTDGDGDGFLACEDCDDTDASVNPDALEVCNGFDDDCDGDVDDDDSSIDSSSQEVWYADTDGDGFGDEDTDTLSCEQPSGYVEDDSDCDDSDDSIHPEAYEICGDGADNDCDGLSTDCELSLSDADFLLRGVTGGDRAGLATCAGDFDNDGIDDVAVGAPGRGSVYIANGPVSTGSLGGHAEWTELSSGDEAGAVLDADDTDADGKTDLAVGAPSADAVYVLLGPVSAGGSLSGAAGLLSGDSGTDFGRHLAWLSNDGNGTADLLVAAPETGETLSPDEGAVYLFTGPVSGSLSASGADGDILGATLDSLGQALVGADTDGDGVDESWIGGFTTGGLGTGGVFGFSGPWTGSLDSSDADVVLRASSGESAGTALASADLDADGYAEIAVASPDASKVYVAYGPVSSDATLSSSDLVLTGTDAGLALLGLEDLDGDGLEELLIGGDDEAWLVLGDASLSGTEALSDASLLFEPNSPGDEAGAALGSGDLDGDGAVDLLFGVPGRGSDKGGVAGVSGAGF